MPILASAVAKRLGGRWTLSSPATTGTAGTLTQLVWDTAVDTPPMGRPIVGVSLSAGDIVLPHQGDYAVSGLVTFEGLALLTAVRVRLSLYDGVTLTPRLDRITNARAVGNTALGFDAILLGAPEGYMLRTEIASIGVGAVTISATDAQTHIVARAV